MNEFKPDLYRESLGIVIGRSVSKGLEIKLNREVAIEKIAVESYLRLGQSNDAPSENSWDYKIDDLFD
ncbi:MAG: hypothetical protein ACJ0OL_01015 [Dehalococcoidia bacterium]